MDTLLEEVTLSNCFVSRLRRVSSNRKDFASTGSKFRVGANSFLLE